MQGTLLSSSAPTAKPSRNRHSERITATLGQLGTRRRTELSYSGPVGAGFEERCSLRRRGRARCIGSLFAPPHVVVNPVLPQF